MLGSLQGLARFRLDQFNVCCVLSFSAAGRRMDDDSKENKTSLKAG